MNRKVEHSKIVLRTTPFAVEELHLSQNNAPAQHPYYRLRCPDWVNILPITREGDAILIRQYRAGSQSIILETPGGVVEAGEEKDPTWTALRELEEETGYTTQKMIFLGALNPNPALQDNRTSYFLALDCQLEKERKRFPDEEEDIEVHKVRTTELEDLIRLGRIDHSLSALCILLAGKYINIRSQ